MKKVLFAIVAISLAAVSCTKESNITISIEEASTGVTTGVIPKTITGVIANEGTKTAYGVDGDFTWLNTDQVRLIVAEDLGTYSRQGIYTYRVDALSGDSKSATFTSTSSAGALTGFVDGDWKSTGYAMYPTTILDRFDTPESHSYGAPWFTLARGNVSGLKSDIILIGVNDDGISNFKFYTAMAVLKVTVKNVPASAAAIKLCTSNKTDYPIDGDFKLSTDGSGKPAITFDPTWVSGFKGYQKIDVSGEGEIASADYYFNIPAATYPENTLSILIEDANGGQIMKRTIPSAITLNRNDCLAMPALTYSYTVTVYDPANAPRISWTIDCKRIRFHVSKDSTNDIANYEIGYTFANDNATGSYSSSYAMASFATNKPTETGQYYLHYLLQSDREGKPASMSAANVVGYGSIPFYYISSSDLSSFAKQYTFSRTDDVNFWHPGTGSNFATTMTLAVSNDASKGNLKISEIYGKTLSNKAVYGALTASDATSITFTYGGNGSTDYNFSANGNYFHVAQSADADVANANSDLVFSIAAGPVLTSSAYIVMKYTSSYPATWGPFIYGNELVFN